MSNASFECLPMKTGVLRKTSNMESKETSHETQKEPFKYSHQFNQIRQTVKLLFHVLDICIQEWALWHISVR